MTIKLELMELVWLQNINRQPGHFKLKDQNQYIVSLMETGLVMMRIIEDGFWITLKGKEVLKRHLPLSICGQDYYKMYGAGY